MVEVEILVVSQPIESVFIQVYDLNVPTPEPPASDSILAAANAVLTPTKRARAIRTTSNFLMFSVSFRLKSGASKQPAPIDYAAREPHPTIKIIPMVFVVYPRSESRPSAPDELQVLLPRIDDIPRRIRSAHTGSGGNKYRL